MATRELIAANCRSFLARKSQGRRLLAREIGLSVSALNRRLRHETSFTADELAAFADALGVPVAALYLDADDVAKGA